MSSVRDWSEPVTFDTERLIKDLTHVLNINNVDSFANTPDYILAETIAYNLVGIGALMHDRDRWFGDV